MNLTRFKKQVADLKGKVVERRSGVLRLEDVRDPADKWDLESWFILHQWAQWFMTSSAAFAIKPEWRREHAMAYLLARTSDDPEGVVALLDQWWESGGPGFGSYTDLWKVREGRPDIETLRLELCGTLRRLLLAYDRDREEFHRWASWLPDETGAGGYKFAPGVQTDPLFWEHITRLKEKWRGR